MAANIQTMVSGRSMKPWHGLGVIVEGLLTAQEALAQGGLDWSVGKEPMVLKSDNRVGVPNAFAVRRADNNAVLGVVGNQYTPLQNRDAFSMMDAIVRDHGSAKYETAGALGAGERVWLQVAVEGDIALKDSKGKDAGDTLQRYILLSNSHDGSSPVMLASTIVRVVCQNTLTAALQSAESLFKVRHTRGMGLKVESARDALGIINKSYEALQEKMAALTRVSVSDAGFDAFITSLGFDVDAPGGKAKGSVDRLRALWGGEGAGSTLSTARGTAWGALNAVTEYVDHERPTRITAAGAFKSEAEARLAAQWWGSGYALKEKALDAAVALAA